MVNDEIDKLLERITMHFMYCHRDEGTSELRGDIITTICELEAQVKNFKWLAYQHWKDAEKFRTERDRLADKFRSYEAEVIGLADALGKERDRADRLAEELHR